MQNKPRPLGRPRKDMERISTKQIILQFATNMFLEKGYPLVSMDDVAKQCDVTKATVYYYYKTKADLFTDAMVQLMLRITRRIVDILSTNQPLKQQLTTLAKVHLQATVDINIQSFMKEAKLSLSEEQQLQMKEAEEKMYKAIEDAFLKAMNEGRLPKRDPRLAAQLFVTMLTVGNNIDTCNDNRFTSLDDIVTQIIDLYWNGLANN